MKLIILIPFIVFLLSCSTLDNENNSLKIDFENSNKRSLDIIRKEKKNILSLNAVFETDTLLNLKSVTQIKSIFGTPTIDRIISYDYREPNITWILEGPLNGLKSYNPVLMMEWYNKEKEVIRVILFVKKNGEWISLCNILYSDFIQY